MHRLLTALASLLALACTSARGDQTPKRCSLPHTRLVEPADGKALAAALADAQPGDLILLRRGTYAGRFTASSSGRRAAPITVCGPRDAVLDGGSLTKGYGLHVTGSRWRFSGFTVAHAKKGIVIDGGGENEFSSLEVRDIGNEAIHFRSHSSDNVLRGSSIHDTGKTGSPHYGEGVYIGSAKSHWCDYTACAPDRSDRNQILDNTIAGTTAESIDAKEGTTGGVIRGNKFSGAGMVDPDGADSWVDVKGNDYLIEGNRGEDAPRDGFQVHAPLPDWGRRNRFHGNVANVGGPGYAISVKGKDTVIACDNVASNAKKGLSNVRCE